MIDLLAKLFEEFPVKRKINVEGFPDGFYLWRLEPQQIFELMKIPHATAEDMVPYALRECQLGIGDEVGPGVFDNEHGAKWLLTHPQAMTALAKAVREFNELTGPSEERKKKSETNESSDCSSLQENLDSQVQGSL
jgi:hypothetical protein